MGSQAGQFCGAPCLFPRDPLITGGCVQLPGSSAATWMQDVLLCERQCLSQAVMIHVGRAEVMLWEVEHDGDSVGKGETVGERRVGLVCLPLPSSQSSSPAHSTPRA